MAWPCGLFSWGDRRRERSNLGMSSSIRVVYEDLTVASNIHILYCSISILHFNQSINQKHFISHRASLQSHIPASTGSACGKVDGYLTIQYSLYSTKHLLSLPSFYSTVHVISLPCCLAKLCKSSFRPPLPAATVQKLYSNFPYRVASNC